MSALVPPGAPIVLFPLMAFVLRMVEDVKNFPAELQAHLLPDGKLFE
jgi:hypothetical protein